MNNISSHLNKNILKRHMCEFASIGHLKHPKKKKRNTHVLLLTLTHIFKATHVFLATLLLSIIQMLPPYPPNSIGHMSHSFPNFASIDHSNIKIELEKGNTHPW
jgi:hypothetical protein